MKIYFTCAKISKSVAGMILDAPDIPFSGVGKLRCAEYGEGMICGLDASEEICSEILAAPGVEEATEALAVSILGGTI